MDEKKAQSQQKKDEGAPPLRPAAGDTLDNLKNEGTPQEDVKRPQPRKRTKKDEIPFIVKLALALVALATLIFLILFLTAKGTGFVSIGALVDYLGTQMDIIVARLLR